MVKCAQGVYLSGMAGKKKDKKERTNIMLKPSVKKIGIAKADKKRVSFSQLIEIMIYEYSAE